MMIISGLSGAGKSIALHTLEDLGYYCIDNLPCSLLSGLYDEQDSIGMPVAVGIDVRSQSDDHRAIAQFIQDWKARDDTTQLLFITAQKGVLIRRYSESRRKHPLSSDRLPLPEAITKEIQLLSTLTTYADYSIDTSQLNIYQLKERIANWLKADNEQQMVLTIESFGFKNGPPIDADLMFDVRFLPNPYWESDIRHLSGLDQPVQRYLGQFDATQQFITDTADYLSRWLPIYLNSHRTYLTLAIGCTGGRHRSVYISEYLAAQLRGQFGTINVRHRDLKNS